MSPTELAPFSAEYLSPFSDALTSQERAFYLLGSVLLALLVSLVLVLIADVFRRVRPPTAEWPPGTPRSVFRDPSGNRAAVLRWVSVFVVVTSLLAAGTFGFALSQPPALPSIGLAAVRPDETLEPVRSQTAPVLGDTQVGEERAAGAISESLMTRPAGVTGQQGEVFAFYVPWDGNSRISLEKNIAAIDVVVPEWFRLRSDLTIADDRQPDIDEYLRGKGVQTHPSISNLIDGRWNREVVVSLITSPSQTRRFTETILALLDSGPYQGINLDFESLQPEDRDAYSAFVATLSAALHDRGYKVSVDLQVGESESYDYRGLAESADHLVMMLYDEHYSMGSAGPVASQAWFEEHVDALAGLPAAKVVLALGNYGYDWNVTKRTDAKSLTVAEALEIARDGGLDIIWDEERLNPHYEYRDGRDVHQVWFLDAATAYNQIAESTKAGYSNFAVWVLGSEEQSLWDVLGQGAPGPINPLSVVQKSDSVHYVGEGEVLRVASTPVEGVRRLEARDGLIVNETYEVLPVPYTVARYGGASRKQVALTFDDGPHERYTPQILDILKDHGVPATFFVIGKNVLKNPEISDRAYREGHEIGVHTFSHPNVNNISDFEYEYELSLTQRVVQNVTGRSTLLFRPPGGVDVYNQVSEEFTPLLKAQEHGYTVVGELMDPLDWLKPPADSILNTVLDGVESGNVILLHDSGGDRSQTVSALPRIIEELQGRGYEFVLVSDLLGMTRDDVMPPVPHDESLDILYAHQALGLVVGTGGAIGWIFVVAITLGLVRFVFLVYFSAVQDRRTRHLPRPIDPGPPVAVSVVIAAFNEEEVICRTIRSVLDSDHPVHELIIVNDGSTDKTSLVVRETFKDHPQVILIEQENAGKSAAINRGFRRATHDIVVAFDADTIVAPQSIGRMVRHFQDPRVAAVSGNIRVGNVRNLLTRWQHIEYVIGFNLERRAFDHLNCVTVVPGAMGAWRKSAVAACGYFPEDTLAEDTDVTLSLLKHGHRVKHEATALAYTEAPADLRSLLKQRDRWIYGTLQSLWKHRSALFSHENRALGWIALPSMWVFQYGFQLVAPLADLVFLGALVGGQPRSALLYYGLFLVVDYLAALHAFRLEGESPRVLVWLFLQRIIYRMIIMVVVIKAILTAIRGIPVGWNKLRRHGDVRIEFTPARPPSSGALSVP